jgi:hypothetical protein
MRGVKGTYGNKKGKSLKRKVRKTVYKKKK